jgi:hypothetical protein
VEEWPALDVLSCYVFKTNDGASTGAGRPGVKGLGTESGYSEFAFVSE